MRDPRTNKDMISVSGKNEGKLTPTTDAPKTALIAQRKGHRPSIRKVARTLHTLKKRNRKALQERGDSEQPLFVPEKNVPNLKILQMVSVKNRESEGESAMRTPE